MAREHPNSTSAQRESRALRVAADLAHVELSIRSSTRRQHNLWIAPTCSLPRTPQCIAARFISTTGSSRLGLKSRPHERSSTPRVPDTGPRWWNPFVPTCSLSIWPMSNRRTSLVRLAYVQTLERIGEERRIRIPSCPGIRYPRRSPARPNLDRGIEDDTDQVPDASKSPPDERTAPRMRPTCPYPASSDPCVRCEGRNNLVASDASVRAENSVQFQLASGKRGTRSRIFFSAGR